jgi:hypothetical protein
MLSVNCDFICIKYLIFAEKHCGVFLLLSCDILHEINPPKKEKTKGAINNEESRCTGNGNKTLVRQRKQRKLSEMMFVIKLFY